MAKATMKARRGTKGGGTRPSQVIYHFEEGHARGHAGMRALLGGKGANLAEMCRIGLPVPPGFTISTVTCRLYYESRRRIPPDALEAMHRAVRRLEKVTGKRWGDPSNPLLVSVRSGAAVSMPGMMDTVLNLGLTASVTEGLARQSGDRRFALDARRRFIQMFGNVVEGLDLERFECILRDVQSRRGAHEDSELDEEALEEVVSRFLRAFRDGTGHAFPDVPTRQLDRAVGAVFGSWMGARAVEYRRIHKVEELLGTAVNVQSMVFGNLGPDSGTGVCFTRDPSTGENVFYGEFLMNAQGEDVVAGIRTPKPLAELEVESPAAYRQLKKIRSVLERHYRNIQDIEFTIERGKLFILQTRTGKTTARAAVRIAAEMAKSRMIARDEAVSRISAEQAEQLLHAQFDPGASREVITKGLPASPGAVSGSIVFTAEKAKEERAKGERVILVRSETSPEDVGGMYAAEGILTATGGMTSHAAVVARGMGRCCVAGAGDLQIDEDVGTVRVRDLVFREGDTISLDGTTGEVMAGFVPTIPADPSPEFEQILSWADRIRKLKVRTNADNPEDARAARRFGAQGIGLCRTEHMFFGEERIAAMREMILSEDEMGRRAALQKLLPYQRRDFAGILEAMDGLPVTIRLLDPPLHEFLPHDQEQAEAVACALGVEASSILERARRLKEMNPMLGHRGCRLGITYPEIYEMQVQAIFEAASEVRASGLRPRPEVMIPLIGSAAEFRFLKARLLPIAKQVLRSTGVRLPIIFGTMIEIPRAALRAGEIAQDAEFFSFGTNDLTQMTFGFSRDDVGSFLPAYLEAGILPSEPFQTLDVDGVGELVRIGVTRGRHTRPQLKIGICGEHGGDPASIAFCGAAGLDYVSCSPFRVPIARLAAAHAALSTSGSPNTAAGKARGRRTAARSTKKQGAGQKHAKPRLPSARK